MGLPLAVLLILGILTTIGMRVLQPLVEIPDYTGNAEVALVRNDFRRSTGESVTGRRDRNTAGMWPSASFLTASRTPR